jgi:predicted anti-sigma-YlaC factor YlaD
MDCSQTRILLSAALDGEVDDGERRRLDDHLHHCSGCRAYAADAARLHRRVRVGPAPPVPDLTGAILAATAPTETRPVATRLLRTILVVCALALVGLAVGTFSAASAEHAGHGGAAYTTRHLTAFDLALAAGFVWTAWRPWRVLAGFLPIATVLVLACLAVTFVDPSDGLHAANHIAAVIGLVSAWLLEAGLRPRRSVAEMRLAA